MAYFHCLIGGGSSGGGYELTVTCDADFAGTTITCTDGVTTLTQTCPSASPYEVVFEIPNGGDWTISGTISGDVYSTSINIPSSLELHYISTPKGSTVLPTDDIQTWLACANITDKSYTTLAEVLADRSTFETLIADSNACDYMARSTTWVDDVADDADAMALIGRYDYCSNALLGNATWAEAIVNSDYTFINPKVPNMTSATTPSGQVISSATPSGRDAYHAFAGANTGSFTVLSTANNAYIGYKFTEKVNIVGFFLHYRSTTSPMPTMQLQCSNTGVNDWVNVGEPIQMTSADQGTAQTDTPSLDHIVSQAEDEGYEYWRLLFSTSASGDLQLFRVQFYGRASSNVSNTNSIIHTANGDTVTCNGNTYVADTNGIIEIDFSDFDEGTYTFTSGIAKDPTDLSNYYSKSFKITKSPYGGTTELYLMPDAVKTLYWWGYVSDNLQNCTSANGWSVQTYSMVAPTYNTSNISMATSSNQLKGVGTASKVNLSSVKAIATGVTISSSVYAVEAIATAKDINNLINYNYLNSDSITLVTLNAGTSGEYNVTFYVTAGRNSTLHALWYE